MKTFLTFLVTLFLFISHSKADPLINTDEKDKKLVLAIQKLEEKDTRRNRKAVEEAYVDFKKIHLDKIAELSATRTVERWKEMLTEYSLLQDAYQLMYSTALIADDFTADINKLKQLAAEENYIAGKAFLQKSGAADLRKAHDYLRAADLFVPLYSDARIIADSLYELDALVVVINPFKADNTFYLRNVPDAEGNTYNNVALASDLAFLNADKSKAVKYITAEEAMKKNIAADYIVELNINYMNASPAPQVLTSKGNFTGRMVIGTDSTGLPIYKWGAATVTYTNYEYTALAKTEILIKDVNNGGDSSTKNLSTDYVWLNRRANFAGDSWVLPMDVVSIVSAAPNSFSPSAENIISALYSKLYPRIIDNINSTVTD